MNSKGSAIFLIIASIFWMIAIIYSGIRSVSNNWEYYKDHLLVFIINMGLIIVPISLIILANSILSNKNEVKHESIFDRHANNTITNFSVGDWVVIYLISIIPLIGLIFIIIWANDDKNMIRKNWAIAYLIWLGIFFILSLILYLLFFAEIII